MTNQSKYDNPTGWKKFQDVIEKLDIPEEGIFYFLKKGLKPWRSILPLRQLPCPIKHHEHPKCLFKYNNNKRLLSKLREFRGILQRVHSENIYICQNISGFLGLWGALEKDIAVDERRPFPSDGAGIVAFNSKNTAWITPSIIKNLRVRLISEGRDILRRIRVISRDDPNNIDWKYAVGPYKGDLLALYKYSEEVLIAGLQEYWPDEEIKQTLSEIRKCYFWAEDVAKFANPQWYSWNNKINQLRITATEKEYDFKNQGAKVIQQFVDADEIKDPEQEYPILQLRKIRESLGVASDRDMKSFFPKQPFWKELIHPLKGKEGFYYFAPSKE